MKRYHATIYFPKEYDSQLSKINDGFNTVKFKYTAHANDNFKTRFDYMEVLQYLANIKEFKKENIFEYYVQGDNIEKLCYKMQYNNREDIIIVLTKDKAIVTVYLNSKNDNHRTLKHELYSTI